MPPLPQADADSEGVAEGVCDALRGAVSLPTALAVAPALREGSGEPVSVLHEEALLAAEGDGEPVAVAAPAVPEGSGARVGVPVGVSPADAVVLGVAGAVEVAQPLGEAVVVPLAQSDGATDALELTLA